MKQKTQRRTRKIIVPKTCYFCAEKKEVDIFDTEGLGHYLTERGKIIGRARSGICLKHQRALTLAIKHARHLAILPFIA